MAPHIPIGTYKARAVPETADFGVAKTGTRQVAVEFEVIDGPQQGKRLTWYGYFTTTQGKDGKTVAARTIEQLQNAGCLFAEGDVTDLGGLGDTEVSLVVVHEPDNEGVTRAKVAWVNKIGGVALANRMSDADRRAFSAAMRGTVIRTQEKASAAASTSAGGAPSKEADPWNLS